MAKWGGVREYAFAVTEDVEYVMGGCQKSEGCVMSQLVKSTFTKIVRQRSLQNYIPFMHTTKQTSHCALEVHCPEMNP